MKKTLISDSLILSIIAGFILLMILALGGCSQSIDSNLVFESVDRSENYRFIDAADAAQMMQDYPDCIILDVRTGEEFSFEHIEGATLLPYDEIYSSAEGVLPDKDQLILIYCRTGRRSEQAANELINMGYTRIYDFGGIVDWPFETVP